MRAGRTLWFIGDSQTWHSYLSAECFLRDYAIDFVRRPAMTGSEGEIPLHVVRGDVLESSVCLELRDNTKICTVRSQPCPPALSPTRA